MKLYKLIKLVGDRGISVFPKEGMDLPEPVDLAGEPMRVLINQLQLYGYTEEQARWIISAWAYAAKENLNQGPRGVRVFCEMCLRQLPKPIPPAPPPYWILAALVACIAAVALGLYIWVTLDQEKNITFGGHRWAYIMSYEERLWQAEILNVGTKQMAYYEREGEFGEVVLRHDRDVGGARFRDVILLKPGRVWLAGRRYIFYYEYRFTVFFVHYCGLLTHLGYGLYKLRLGGDDPYKPVGPWSRPGGRWGTPPYAGCWQDWWWF